MSNYSDHPLSVDGVRLDTYAYGIESAKRRAGGVREADTVVPGHHGVLAGLDEDYEPGGLTLSMLVRGTDEDGIVQADSVGALQANLDMLLHLFSKRHALLDVREVVDDLGTVRQAWAKVTDAIEPSLEPGSVARFTVSLTIPGAFWQDPDPADATLAIGAGAGAAEATTLRGATAPITDGRFLVTGPVDAPTIYDDATGAWAQLAGVTLAAGDAWLLDAGTWVSRYGPGLTLDSADTAGTDGMAATEISSTGAMLTLVPALDTGERRVKVRLAGSGRDGTTAVKVRARRRFR